MFSHQFFSFLFVFMAALVLSSSAHASSYVDWENAYWSQYSNTLPNLSVVIDASEKHSENQKLLLTKITRSNIDHLELLQYALQQNRQTRPRGGMELSSRLLAGNDHSTIPGISGWLIQLEEKDQLTPVGFIAYGYYRDTYYGREYPHQPIAFCELSRKRCYEIEWYVNPNYQRRGIASAALDLVIDYCRSVNHVPNHMDYLLAVIAPDNTMSADFAQKKHFQALGKDVGTSQHIWSLPLNP